MARCCVRLLIVWPLLVAGAMAWDPDEYSPLFPAPVFQSNGSRVLRIYPNVSWTIISGSTSEIVNKAITRYQKIMFAWPARSTPMFSAKVDVDGILKQICVKVESTSDDLPTLAMNESYTLTVGVEDSGKDVVLTAPTVWGVLRGLESLSQLVEWDSASEAYLIRKSPWKIRDFPRFKHRGLLIDTARHFLQVKTILRQIDAAAFVKFNVIHWHIVDADSFPFQSKPYPELSRLGAYSAEAVYTAEDVARVVEYGRQRGIRVLVEFDLPSHSTSWRLAKPDLFINCGVGPDGDFEGISRMLDPTAPGLDDFLEPFFSDVASRFPDPVLHLGGDEINVGCLNRSAGVRAWVDAHNSTIVDLVLDFERRVHAIASRHNKTVQLWADTFAAAKLVNSSLPQSVIVQVWGRAPSVSEVVKSGHRVVRSTGYYLSSGNSATGGCPVVWEDIYDTDIMPEGLSAAEEARVLGAEAAMWGEVTDDFNIDSKTWLRASVLAERLWSQNSTIAAAGAPWPASYHSPDISSRMVKNRCRLLQRGIQAQPYNTQALPDRNRWIQCQLWLPPRSET